MVTSPQAVPAILVVTGASGFLGGHLVRALRARFPSASIRAFDAASFRGPLPDGVRAIEGRVEQPGRLVDVVTGADAVIHLAAKVDPSSHDADELHQINVEGTMNVYSAAVASGCALFVHLSSAGVYGDPHRAEPFYEDDLPNPTTPYQRSKWEAEQALRGMPSRTRVNILRPAGIYGPGSRLEIPEYRRIACRKWAVELKGGVIVHPTYVEDVVQAILALVARPAEDGAVFNIGGERAVRLQELQALIAETLAVRRRRVAVPSWLAVPFCAAVAPVLAFGGRRNPRLRGMARGEVFSAAVDDRRFRSRYPDVPVTELEVGLRRHADWAMNQRLL